LVAGADADPESERHRPYAGDALRDDALAGVELREDDLLHGPIVSSGPPRPRLRHEVEAAARPLRLVEGRVCEAEERLRVGGVVGAGGATEAGGDADEPLVTRLLEQALGALHDLAGVVVARLREQHRE